jgi:hypothetical protein
MTNTNNTNRRNGEELNQYIEKCLKCVWQEDCSNEYISDCDDFYNLSEDIGKDYIMVKDGDTGRYNYITVDESIDRGKEEFREEFEMYLKDWE